MRRRRLASLIALAMGTIIIAGCGTESTYVETATEDVEISEEANEIEDASDATEMLEDTDDAIGETLTSGTIDSKLEERYMKVLDGSEAVRWSADDSSVLPLEDWASFCDIQYLITDLNEDEVPELIVNVYNGWFNIFTCIDDEIVYVNSGFYTGANGEVLLENGNIMLIDTIHANRESYEVYNFDGTNELKMICYFAHWWNDEQTEDTYQYSGTDFNQVDEITKEEYDDLYDGYMSQRIEVQWTKLEAVVFDIDDSNLELTTSNIYTESMTYENKFYEHTTDYDYEGEMGTPCPEWGDLNLGKDMAHCEIVRYCRDNTVAYSAICGNKELFYTKNYFNAPNSLEMFYFCENESTGVDAVLAVSTTESTAGFDATDVSTFTYDIDNDKWVESIIYDYEKNGFTTDAINNDIEDIIKDTIGVNESGLARVEDVILGKSVLGDSSIIMMLDFGGKDGADQGIYRRGLCVSLDGKLYAFDDELLTKYWPLDCK